MTSEQIFRTVLEELAAEGNQRAAFALSMAARMPAKDINAMKQQVSERLAQANTSLLSALNSNDSEWTKRTDRHINSAQEQLMGAMRILAS